MRVVMGAPSLRARNVEKHLERGLTAHFGLDVLTLIRRGFPTDELREEHDRGVPDAFDRLERHIRDR